MHIYNRCGWYSDIRALRKPALARGGQDILGPFTWVRHELMAHLIHYVFMLLYDSSWCIVMHHDPP